MAKKKQDQSKKRKLNNSNPTHVSNAMPRPERSPSPTTLVSADDLETAIYVLKTLSEDAGELADKSYKDLKKASYELHRVLAAGAGIGSSLTSRISAALQDYRFTDALVLLNEMHIRGVPPKLGALQRWVRECDATSSADGKVRDADAMKCLDMMLRIVGTPVASSSSGSEIVKRNPVWTGRGSVEGEIPIWKLIQDERLFDGPSSPHPSFKKVHHLKGSERRPPNIYDSTVYASSPSTIALTPTSNRRPATRVDVPGVPGAFLVMDVFTPDECLQIVKAAYSIGFERDEAAGGSAAQKNSILAHNFLWLADSPFLKHFYEQLLPFVPQTAPVSTMSDGKKEGGGNVRGINARFRVYRYCEGQVYRPHIDGAWPAAGLHSDTGEYMHDSSPPNDPLWSRYTLLVYLNSDIPTETGCTTFFLPSKETGVLEATSVRPVQGAVLCFPHGDTQGSLLHEGSAVGPNGGKLVIRTDLLYEAQGFGEFKPPASVGVKQGGKAEEGLGG